MQKLLPVLAALPLSASAFADVKVYQNDSLPLTGGGVVACQAGFIANEIGAASFDVPPSDGKILILEAQWWACDGSGIGFAQPRPMQVQVYPAGGPNPGAPVYVSPDVTATPGFLNLFPIADQNLTFDGGDTFTVGIQLQPSGLFQQFTTLATDADGCQPGKSLIFAIPGGWADACSFGVSGDMFVRARVLTEGPTTYGAGTPGTGGQVPAIDSAGPWFIGGAFEVTCSNAATGTPGFLGISTAPSALPLFGGTVLIDPTAVGATFVPTVSSGAGTASLPTPIPGGNPGLIGARVYFQYGFLDGGAAGGVSMSAGLDVKISNNT
ncbi:MAG: hypothetical protein AAF682_25450 [Planctomycetota bacterium]